MTASRALQSTGPSAASAQPAIDVRRVARWGHVARLAVASSVFSAAVWAWDSARPADTRTAALAFAAAVVGTGLVVWQSELRPGATTRAIPAALLALLAVLDLALTTAAVHVTGGGASQFAALYVLVIVAAALTLPFARAAAVAALGCALYALDVLWWRPAPGDAASLALQLGLFGAVALAAGGLGTRLRVADAGGEALARALARARLEADDVLRSLRSGVVTVDAEGRLLFANPAASALLGIELAGRIGRPVLDAVGGASPALAAALARASRDGERTTRAEAAASVPDGAVTLGVTTTVGAGAEGARTATAIFSDITGSKQLAALHLRAERLGAVAELAASLAHEIRNPLASIRSAVEQLARLAAAAERGPLGADQAADARALGNLTARESDRLSRLLGEFLDFSRARVTRRERLAVGELVRAAAGVAAAHPDAAEVRVVVDADAAGEGVPCEVDGDGELLHQALFNLILNAAQATAPHRGPGGTVRITVGTADPAELPEELAFSAGAIAIHVADDGPGIPPAVVDKLFDPFFTTRPGGSGLGLAVVERAVQAHGGVVLVDAGGRGCGARLTCLLPSRREERGGEGVCGWGGRGQRSPGYGEGDGESVLGWGGCGTAAAGRATGTAGAEDAERERRSRIVRGRGRRGRVTPGAVALALPASALSVAALPVLALSVALPAAAASHPPHPRTLSPSPSP